MSTQTEDSEAYRSAFAYASSMGQGEGLAHLFGCWYENTYGPTTDHTWATLDACLNKWQKARGER